MNPSVPPRPPVTRAMRQWWNEVAGHRGRWQASRELLRVLLEFLRDSTPERRRQRYGDADYDWEFRVNTTSGAVGWRDRLLGSFHSAYQPTEPAAFHAMLADLQQHTHLDFREFFFLDLGSGKGRTLLMAADYPFRRIAGVELLPALHQIALENIANYHSDSQRCFAIESVCADATTYAFPPEPTVLYLFNPFPVAALRRVLTNLEQSLRMHPRQVYVLYHNPLLADVFEEFPAMRRIGGSHHYAMYSAGVGPE